MLSIAMIRGDGSYYTKMAREGYYANTHEKSGTWFGQGAQLFGLSGSVEAETLRNLFLGYSPDGSTQLVQNAGSDTRQAGWDLTFSAPKSVSVVWAVCSPEVRAEIEKAHEQAVKESLSIVEEKLGITRRASGGSVEERAALSFALFEHGTSRALDPQLHTHGVLINAAIREDGTTGTLVSKPIYKEKKALGRTYREALAEGLERIGFEIERKGQTFQVRGVPEGLCSEFSKQSPSGTPRT